MRKLLDLVGFDFEEVTCDYIMVGVILLLVVSLLVWMGMKEVRRESLAKCGSSIGDFCMIIDLCCAKNLPSLLFHILFVSQCKTQTGN